MVSREQITFTPGHYRTYYDRFVDGSMTSCGAILPPRSCPRCYKYSLSLGGARFALSVGASRTGERERNQLWSRTTLVATTCRGGGGDSSFRRIDDSSIVEGSTWGEDGSRRFFGKDVVHGEWMMGCGGESSRKEASPLNI